MLEAELQATVLEAAAVGGWRVGHFGTAQTSKGWRTPVRADGKGWPDLVLCRPKDSLLCWELKSDTGRVSVDQAEWLRVLGLATAPEARVIRPADLEWAIERLLQRTKP